MKQWKPVVAFFAVVTAIAVSLSTCVSQVADGRSVRPLPLVGHSKSDPWFARKQSAALFVGVRKFSSDDTADVPYAVDDAVDLAHLFALDPRVPLVLPRRVVLALSGKPQKEESKRRLRELEAAGAKVAPATQSGILTLLRQQANSAGKDGILIVSLATHGFLRDGVPYLLGEGSSFEIPETALRATTILEMADTSPAARSLILIDACRNRISATTRGGEADASTAAPALEIVRRMARTSGQAAFYAAAAGQYAYDDPKRQNGVFTSAILDALQCKAALTNGVVNAQNLETYVDRQVRNWMRVHKRQSLDRGIQASIDGGARNMPLACCRPPCYPGSVSGPIAATKDGSTIIVTESGGTELGRYDAGAPIADLEVADLDVDGSQEVVASVRGGGGGGGQLLVLNRRGARIGGADEAMTLETFVTGDLMRKGPQHIVALWNDERSSRSRLSVYDSAGKLHSSYEHQGHLQFVTIGRPTGRHAPRLVVTGVDERGEARVLLLEPKKLASGKATWTEPVTSERITALKIIDANGDKKNDIAVSTVSGSTYVFDFHGNVIDERRKPK